MDKTGRIIGMSVFILGIIILIFVFYVAYSMFTSPVPGLASSSGAGSDITAVGLGGIIVSMIIRILLLFVMTLAGSMIASRGIHLYIGSKDRIQPDSVDAIEL